MANEPMCNSLERDPLMRLQEGTSDAVYTTSSSCSKGSRGGAMRSSVASRLLRAVSLLSLATLTWTYSPAGVSMHALLNRSHSLATLHKRACAFIPMPRKGMCLLPGCKPGTSCPWLHLAGTLTAWTAVHLSLVDSCSRCGVGPLCFIENSPCA